MLNRNANGFGRNGNNGYGNNGQGISGHGNNGHGNNGHENNGHGNNEHGNSYNEDPILNPSGRTSSQSHIRGRGDNFSLPLNAGPLPVQVQVDLYRTHLYHTKYLSLGVIEEQLNDSFVIVIALLVY